MNLNKEYLPLLDIENVIMILKKISILGGLSDKQLYIIFKKLKKVYYDNDEIVFMEGDEPSHIYIIKTGIIKLVANFKDTPLELITLSQGQCLGETSVIGIQPHSATAVAVINTELLVLSKKALMEIFYEDKALFSILILNIAREACRRLHNTEKTMLHYVLQK